MLVATSEERSWRDTLFLLPIERRPSLPLRVGIANEPMAAAVLIASVLMIATLVQAHGSTAAAPDRIVVRGAVLTADDGPRAGMSIVVEGGVIIAIVPDGEPTATLRPGDTPMDARGDVVAPGLIAWHPIAAPTYAELARAPFDGVVTVVAPCDARDVAWRRRIGETASFRAAELLPAPVGAAEALATLERLHALPRPGPTATRSERSAWLRARTVEMASAAGGPPRGALEVGQQADLVFLDADPRDDLSTYDRPIQVLLGGRPARRAEMETNRRFVEAARRALDLMTPAPKPRISFDIESSGLLVGRLDVAPGGDAATERWVPPVSTGHDWRLVRRGATWSHEGLMTIGERTRLRVEASRVEESIRVRGWLEGADAEVSETTLEAGADEPLFDPVSVAARRRDRLMRLGAGESDEFEVVEIQPVDQSLRMGVRRLAWRRMEVGPVGIDAARERIFRLEASTPGAAAASPPGEIGWVVLDASGLPRWAALIADAGITEYRRRPQPSAESVP